MPRVIHFDIHTREPERAVRFYSEVFGWKAQKWDGPMDYWLIQTGSDGEPGINGGLSKQDADKPLTTMNTIGVSSVDEYTEKITRSGGKVVMDKAAIPGVGYFAQCQDTEGNLFGIMQLDPAAK